MAIIESVISAEIQALTESLNSGDVTKKSATQIKKEFADGMAGIIANAIKSAQLVIPSGTIITVGSPSTQTQSVPGVVQNGLS